MIKSNGWSKYSIWEHSNIAKTLYFERAMGKAVEMTCHSQAVEILRDLLINGESVLDVGCGTGYFYHSFLKRGIPIDYHGIDASAHFIETGRNCLKDFGLPPDRLQNLRIEDMGGEVDHVVCINVLSNMDNIYRPLERMLKMAKRTVVLRESFARTSSCKYVVDKYLDSEEDLRTYVNTYPIGPVCDFVQGFGFSTKIVTDEYTGGKVQDVIDYPHHWAFLVATKEQSEK
jgi:ubiquinone/menaquinone biosynthesis C-methylase UbiE